MRLPGLESTALTPEEVIGEAVERWSPIATVCLFSGGGDSIVLAHRCREFYEALAFIDTGTALPGVIEHVQRFAAQINKPLRILSAGDAYRRMVLGSESEQGYGFPGPGQHAKAYTRLKERQIEALLADLKQGHARADRVLFLTGVRRAESARRATRAPITKHRGKVFANPLIDWSDDEMRDYRAAHDLPESDAAALLHRSGECNCGAYAAPGEREMLRDLFPDWFAGTIAPLEADAAAAGISRCVWGARDGTAPTPGGPMCTDCDDLFALLAGDEADNKEGR